jgi:hypothetical protein
MALIKTTLAEPPREVRAEISIDIAPITDKLNNLNLRLPSKDYYSPLRPGDQPSQIRAHAYKGSCYTAICRYLRCPTQRALYRHIRQIETKIYFKKD